MYYLLNKVCTVLPLTTKYLLTYCTTATYYYYYVLLLLSSSAAEAEAEAAEKYYACYHVDRLPT